MIAAIRDCSFYPSPSGFGLNPRPVKFHVIVDRDSAYGRGPACGYPFHSEDSETPASKVQEHRRCMRPGCRARWAELDKGKGHEPAPE